MNKTLKYILLALILALMLIPSVEGFLDVIPEAPLDGDFEQTARPPLTTENWFDRTYQDEMVRYTEENIGLHNSLVRLYNQISFSLFKATHGDNIVYGLDGQLYQADYIRAWTGKDFIGEQLIDKKLRRFAFLQQYLSDTLGINLVLVLEPGKASVYPEYIPARFNKAAQGKSNYDLIRMKVRELGIAHIDFNEYFIHMRDTVNYPLFPKYGTHWSEFAMWYAADSLLSYIEHIRQVDLPDVVLDKIDFSAEYRSTDYDAGQTLNLLCDLSQGPMPYRQFHLEEADSGEVRPAVLSVADSYYWNIYHTGIPEHVFAGEDFWYFYKYVYPETYANETLVDELDLGAEVEKQDVIFLMMTERFMYKLDRGFVEDLFGMYGMPSLLDSITEIKNEIVAHDPWFEQIIRKAEKRNISLAEMMEEDARYVFRNRNPVAYFSLYGPAALLPEIRNNEQWYESVRRNALVKDLPIEEQILEEASVQLSKDYPRALENYSMLTAMKDSIAGDSLLSAQLERLRDHYLMTEEEALQALAERLVKQDVNVGPIDPL